MNFSEICRTCLNYSNLNPIFINEDKRERLSKTIFLCAGIQVEFDDGLPQNICTTCMIQLNNTLKFRKQCKVVEEQLLKIKTELQSETCIDINCLKQTDNTLKEKLLIVKENRSNSNVTKIKSEFYNHVDVKSEPFEIDINDDKSLKLLINRNTSVVLENDDENDQKDDDENIAESIEYSDNETSLNKTEKGFNLDKAFVNVNDSYEDVTNTRDRTKCNDSIPEQKFNDKLELNDDKLESNDSKLEFNETDNPTDPIPTPYYVVTKPAANKTLRVVCKFCHKELSIRSIDSHVARRHPGADERKVKCELCDKYVMKEKLNRHNIMMHGSIGVKCGYCKLDFKSQEVLRDHVKTCTAKKRRRPVQESSRVMAECDVCKMKMQKASLRTHKAVKHAGLRPVCEHCGRSFGNKFRLKEHYRAKHGYEKIQCSYCDFRSAGVMAMRNHERRHRGEKPFVCEACGAKFHAAYLLAQHKHSHRTDKLVKCDLCPAIFKANNSLHTHKLTCHSSSLYRCTICCRTYKCRYYAVKHARVSHSVTGTPPVVKIVT